MDARREAQGISAIFTSRATKQTRFLAATRWDGTIWAHFRVARPRHTPGIPSGSCLELRPTRLRRICERKPDRLPPMLLMIDNYDSFTWNLVQYLGELGADVHVHRNDAITLSEIAAWEPTHIVISPGPCTPNEAGISVPLIRDFAGKIPILGVCLGHQAI